MYCENVFLTSDIKEHTMKGFNESVNHLKDRKEKAHKPYQIFNINSHESRTISFENGAAVAILRK